MKFVSHTIYVKVGLVINFLEIFVWSEVKNLQVDNLPTMAVAYTTYL